MQPLRPPESLASNPYDSLNIVDPSLISTETQKLIKSVADKVARKGSTYELQLRLRDKHDKKLPFLYLDHPLAPFYQAKLIEARSRQRSAPVKVAAVTDAGELQSEYASGSSPAGLLGSGYRYAEQEDQDQSWLGDLQSGIMGQPSASGNAMKAQNEELAKIIQSTNYQYPDPTTVSLHLSGAGLMENDAQLLEQLQDTPVQLPSTIGNGYLSSVEPQSTPNAAAYDVNQEVHLLDSSGNESSGLTTYIIVDNSEGQFCENARRLTTSPDQPWNAHHSSDPTDDLIYTVVPCTSTKFRTIHSRLLPVGFALGAEVQQSNNCAASIVIKRTVKDGKRYYDLKDEFSAEHKDVAEEDLTPHTGGLFGFRLPTML